MFCQSLRILFLGAIFILNSPGCVCRNTLPPGPSAFHGFDEAVRFARWAEAAYSNDDSLKAALSGFDTIVIFNAPKTQGRFFWAFRAADSVQLIGCRGTDNLNNAVTDAKAIPEYAGEAAVKLHKGFLESSREAWPLLQTVIKKESRIWLTGHSLGGAEAVVLAMFLKKDGYKVEKVVTFGQPKVTDASGSALWHDLPLVRFIHKKDVVPLVPTQGCFLFLRTGFYHFGESLTILGQGHYSRMGRNCSADRREAEFWKGLVSVAGEGRPVKGAAQYLGNQVPDHFMARYIAALDSLKLGATEIPCN